MHIIFSAKGAREFSPAWSKAEPWVLVWFAIRSDRAAEDRLASTYPRVTPFSAPSELGCFFASTQGSASLHPGLSSLTPLAYKSKRRSALNTYNLTNNLINIAGSGARLPDTYD
jgi:hypothetical protein